MSNTSPWSPSQRAIFNLMHVVPHLNGRLEIVTNTFDYLQPHNGFLKYVFSIFPIPIIIFICGFIMWLVIFAVSIKLAEKARPYMHMKEAFNIAHAVLFTVLLVSMFANFFLIEESLSGLRVFVDNLSEIQSLIGKLLGFVNKLSLVEANFQVGYSSCSSIIPSSMMSSSDEFLKELTTKIALFQHKLEGFSLSYTIKTAENLVHVLTIALYTTQAITFAIILSEAISTFFLPASKFDTAYTIIVIHSLAVLLVVLILMAIIMVSNNCQLIHQRYFNLPFNL